MQDRSLRSITRQFVDPLLELEFRSFTASANGSVIRLIAAIYAIGCVPYYILNWQFDWVDLQFNAIMVVWFVVGLVAALIAVWPRLHQGRRQADWVVSAFELGVLCLTCAVGWTLQDADRALNLVFYIFLTLAMWVLVPNRIRYIFVVSGISSAGYASLLLIKPAMGSYPTILAVWVLVIAHGLGYLTRRRNESLERRHFSSLREAERQSAALEDAVARTDAVADRFALLSDLLPDALLVLDAHGCIVRSNDRANALLASTSESLQGRPVGSLLGVSQIPSQHSITLPIKHSGREARLVEVTVAMLPPGRDGWRTLVLLHDVSDYQRTAADLREMARTDPLTELLNRRGFEELAQRILMRSHREAPPACVLFADLDRFKQVNDVYGHPIGDAALRSAADCLRRAVRPGDPVGRFGGEEFVVLLPNTDLVAAEQVAERVRALIEASLLQLVDGRSVSLSISVGVTLMTQQEPLSVAVDRADRAMLLAKRSGRNRVISLPSATLY